MNSLKNIYNNLSRQGKWAWWVAVIMILNSAISMLLLPKHLAIFPFILTLVIVGPLLVYQINCLVVGKCNIYAWAVLLTSLLGQTLLLISHVIVTRKGLRLVNTK